MDITIPALPLGIVTLLAFFGPYAVGALNALLPFVKKAWQRKLVSIVVAILLAVVVVLVYLLAGGTINGWSIGALILLAVLVIAASYAFVTKSTASAVEASLTN